MLDIETTDTLPPVRRGSSRPSEERKQIQDALQKKEVNIVKNVEAGNKYNALQQRIRQAARNLRRFFDTADERLHNVAPIAARGE